MSAGAKRGRGDVGAGARGEGSGAREAVLGGDVDRVVVLALQPVHRVAARLEGPVVDRHAGEQRADARHRRHPRRQRGAREPRVRRLEVARADVVGHPLHRDLEDVVGVDGAVGGRRRRRRRDAPRREHVPAPAVRGAEDVGGDDAAERALEVLVLLVEGLVRVRLLLGELEAVVAVVQVLDRRAHRLREAEELRQHEEQRRRAARLEHDAVREDEERRLRQQVRVELGVRLAVQDRRLRVGDHVGPDGGLEAAQAVRRAGGAVEVDLELLLGALEDFGVEGRERGEGALVLVCLAHPSFFSVGGVTWCPGVG